MISEFFAMGGYSFYIWMSYGIGFGLLAYQLIMSQMGHENVIKKIRNYYTKPGR